MISSQPHFLLLSYDSNLPVPVSSRAEVHVGIGSKDFGFYWKSEPGDLLPHCCECHFEVRFLHSASLRSGKASLLSIFWRLPISSSPWDGLYFPGRYGQRGGKAWWKFSSPLKRIVHGKGEKEWKPSHVNPASPRCNDNEIPAKTPEERPARGSAAWIVI